MKADNTLGAPSVSGNPVPVLGPERGPAPVLQVRDLSVCLPAGADRPLAVNAVSFDIPAGQTLCVVGESGSGKSMIANAVMGLLPVPHVRATGGTMVFEGEDLRLANETRLRALRGQRIAMIFQEPMTSLNPVMRVGEQLQEVLDCHCPDMPGAIKRQKVIESLRDVGLPEPEQTVHSYPFRLSGGQRQRVMIACAMLLEPTLLIADEPTTALDVTTQAQILTLMKDLQRRKGMALLFITHDFGVVAQIADRVVVMQTGSVVESGDAQTVLRSPQHPYTRKLIEAIPQGVARATAGADQRPPLLEVRGLNKTYRSGGGWFKPARTVHAANALSFTLREGETLGIVGESGSGKSTVGRCLTGLIPMDSGELVFAGQPLAADVRHRRLAQRGQVQMVFQDPYASLNPRQSVGSAIAAGPLAQGVPRDEAWRRTRELLQLVGLKHDATDRYPHEFSGGQRQRIAIARALAMRPRLIVADEPVSALDVSVQAQVLELFEQVRRDFQLSMVFITHDLRVAAQMCDHIAVMRRGEVVEHGETAAVLGDPQHAYTRELIAAAPRF
ncbi:MAG: ABC transporter ATP-binding protein [Hydrogenophaga sp.]|jgi:peptide/nickel transport system ATP-binding protein|nr:ABC transporter ATP-binding protein [Hydrogenophaga sp.]